MKYKLLALDIDGTLVGKEDSLILPAEREALDQVIKRGVHVSLCTGRSPKASSKILRQLALNGYHAFFDGALVCNPDNGHELYAQPLDVKLVAQAVAFTRKHYINLELYSSMQYFAERETWSTMVHRDFFGIEAVITGFEAVLGKERIVKGGLVATNMEEVAKVKLFSDHFGKDFHFSWVNTPAYPGVDFINMVAASVNKGNAIAALAAHLKISQEEIMAIGDGANDVTLLKVAGLAIAMQDAPSCLKEVADYVTGGVEQSGVAAAIAQFLLV